MTAKFGEISTLLLSNVFGLCMNEFSFWVGALLDCLIHTRTWVTIHSPLYLPASRAVSSLHWLVVHVFPARQHKLFIFVYYVWMFFTITGMKFIQFYDWK